MHEIHIKKKIKYKGLGYLQFNFSTAYDFLNSNRNTFNVNIWYNATYKDAADKFLRTPRSLNLVGIQKQLTFQLEFFRSFLLYTYNTNIVIFQIWPVEVSCQLSLCHFSTVIQFFFNINQNLLSLGCSSSRGISIDIFNF